MIPVLSQRRKESLKVSHKANCIWYVWQMKMTESTQSLENTDS